MPCRTTPSSALTARVWDPSVRSEIGAVRWVSGRSPVAVSTNARLWAPAEKDCSDDAAEQLQTFFGEPIFTFGGLSLYEFSE